MSHHHNHHDNNESMSFEEKAVILIEHWIQHNDDHMKSYMQRGEEAKLNGYEELYKIICEVGELTKRIDEKLKSALKSLK